MRLPPDLAARYRPIQVLGRGGFGVVLRVEDLRLGRAAALKLLHATAQDPEVRRRFLREATLTARLRHPHLVEVYEHGVSADGQPWVTYQLIEGEDWLDFQQRRAPTRRTLAAQGAQVARALAVVHDAGVVHRDLKPENVLVDEQGRAVLCDLGIARSADPETIQTATGVMLGTPAYMAPEVLGGARAETPADQFGLAVTLLVLATGRWAYGGADLRAALDFLSSGRDRALPEGAPVDGDGLVEVLAPALARDPADRYPDCAAFARALEAFAAATAPPARHVAQPEPEPEATRVLTPVAAPSAAAASPSTPVSLTSADPRSPRLSGRRPRWALGLVTALAVGFWFAPSRAPPDAPTPTPASDPEAEDAASTTTASNRAPSTGDPETSPAGADPAAPAGGESSANPDHPDRPLADRLAVSNPLEVLVGSGRVTSRKLRDAVVHLLRTSNLATEGPLADPLPGFEARADFRCGVLARTDLGELREAWTRALDLTEARLADGRLGLAHAGYIHHLLADTLSCLDNTAYTSMALAVGHADQASRAPEVRDALRARIVRYAEASLRLLDDQAPFLWRAALSLAVQHSDAVAMPLLEGVVVRLAGAEDPERRLNLTRTLRTTLLGARPAPTDPLCSRWIGLLDGLHQALQQAWGDDEAQAKAQLIFAGVESRFLDKDLCATRSRGGARVLAALEAALTTGDGLSKKEWRTWTKFVPRMESGRERPWFGDPERVQRVTREVLSRREG